MSRAESTRALPGHRCGRMPFRPPMERMSIDIVTGEAPPPARRGGVRRVLALVAGALFLLGLWPAAGRLSCLGGRGRSPALLRPPPPARPRLELRAGRGPGLAGVAWHTHAATAPGGGAGRAGGARAHVLPALGPRRRARLLRRRRLGLVSVFVLSGPARIATAGSARHAVSTCTWCAPPRRTLAVVGESEADVAATARAFQVTIANVGESGPGLSSQAG